MRLVLSFYLKYEKIYQLTHDLFPISQLAFSETFCYCIQMLYHWTIAPENLLLNFNLECYFWYMIHCKKHKFIYHNILIALIFSIYMIFNILMKILFIYFVFWAQLEMLKICSWLHFSSWYWICVSCMQGQQAFQSTIS